MCEDTLLSMKYPVFGVVIMILLGGRLKGRGPIQVVVCVSGLGVLGPSQNGGGGGLGIGTVPYQ